MRIDLLQDFLEKEAHALAWQLPENISGPKPLRLANFFRRCFLNTVQTAVRFTKEDEPFVITGDIPAMWLRDSVSQVMIYSAFAEAGNVVGDFLKHLLWRHFHYILLDPYANAFNEAENWNGHDDETQRSPWVWERKYEVDSLCYPLQLLHRYWKKTGDASVFSEEVKAGIARIIALWKTEQNHADSPYRFQRHGCPQSDTLPFAGAGTPVAYTGMTWSGFRPSDDACKYGYLIPANMFAHAVLGYVAEFAAAGLLDQELLQKANALRGEIESGIQKYGIVDDPQFGKIYAYETDGMGNYNLMDDANVPSLLAIPYLGYAFDPGIYDNTRRFILSERNPYYYQGNCASGMGSSHTPQDYIWHIGLTMQGITSGDNAEKYELLRCILATDAKTGLLHESFCKDDPCRYTRPWFGWANSLFAQFVIQLLEEGFFENDVFNRANAEKTAAVQAMR